MVPTVFIDSTKASFGLRLQALMLQGCSHINLCGFTAVSVLLTMTSSLLAIGATIVTGACAKYW